MLEIRYVTATGRITGWRSDSPGELTLENHPGEALASIDAPKPLNISEAWLYDEATQSLVANPAYIEPYNPNPDRIRAKELLSTSPAAITQPEMWELMRIFGRFHGLTD